MTYTSSSCYTSSSIYIDMSNDNHGTEEKKNKKENCNQEEEGRQQTQTYTNMEVDIRCQSDACSPSLPTSYFLTMRTLLSE